VRYNDNRRGFIREFDMMARRKVGDSGNLKLSIEEATLLFPLDNGSQAHFRTSVCNSP
jgi:hypothetical protein